MCLMFMWRMRVLPERNLGAFSFPRAILHKTQNRPGACHWLQKHSVTGMTPRKDSIPHETRTAAEPRQNKLYTVRLAGIEQINLSVRLLRLSLTPEESVDGDLTPDSQPQETFSFLPGQWLDVHVPGIPQAGGFTITSTPADAQPLPFPDPTIVQDGTEELLHQQGEFGVPPAASEGRYPYVELAVQDSPSNPPAAWLWQPQADILGKELQVRVGGSFVWPPASMPLEQIRKVVFVAGGVGINPLISILSHLTEPKPSTSPGLLLLPEISPNRPLSIDFFYTTRMAPSSNMSNQADNDDDIETRLQQTLFLPRLCNIAQRLANTTHPAIIKLTLHLFLTNLSSSSTASPLSKVSETLNKQQQNEGQNHNIIRVHNRRINKDDLSKAVSKETSANTVCYVCGPPPMTDDFVQYLETVVGKDRVFYEKWW